MGGSGRWARGEVGVGGADRPSMFCPVLNHNINSGLMYEHMISNQMNVNVVSKTNKTKLLFFFFFFKWPYLVVVKLLFWRSQNSCHSYWPVPNRWVQVLGAENWSDVRVDPGRVSSPQHGPHTETNQPFTLTIHTNGQVKVTSWAHSKIFSASK